LSDQWRIGVTPFEYSRFLSRWAETHDPDHAWLLTEGAIRPDLLALRRSIEASSRQPTAVFDQEIRQLRNRHQAGLIYRLLHGIDSFSDTVAVTTALAETCLQASLDHHQAILETAFGTPAHRGFVVLGMGKLGGRELNLSSDIDIFCIFAEDGETSGPRVREHGEFFTRLTQQMAKSLDAQTVDGFVARVDQRLRPWGAAGQLAIPVVACEDYYEVHGREWERFALLKARPVAGDLALGHALLTNLRPFMYRKYLDFGVFESIRDLKSKIEAEVRRAGRETDVKVGRGGIREAEFIIQAMQLLRGGQIPALQVTGFLQALDALVETEVIATTEAHQLRDDYLWLRQVEHVIQAEDDQQTQALPQDCGPLALMLGYDSAATFERQRREVTERVNQAFSEFLRIEEPEPGISRAVDAAVAELLDEMRHDETCERLEPVARGRLLTLLKQLGPELSEYPLVVTERMLRFISTCTRRSAYLALLSENQGTRARMLDILNRSSWITERLIEMPALLDELLTLNADEAVLTRDEIGQELSMRLQRVDPEDPEQLTETLAQFARGLAFRVAVFEVRQSIPLMRVSDQLTWVAEAVVTEVLHQAYREAFLKHGAPVRIQLSDANTLGLAVLGYGKLGGIEMNYGSDLDLVFVHDIDPDQLTDGAQPIEGGVFLNRVVRRVIALLETTTRFGKLYEIDTRLRPSGRSGLMVVGLSGLEKYLDESAWTWELQAFVRARPVAGDQSLQLRLAELRKSVLIQARDRDRLLQDVVAMREKMRTHLGGADRESDFDLKHGRGGIVDIEFMVQYLILAHADAYPKLADYTDNIRQLEALATVGCITTADSEALKTAYVRYRALNHEAILAGHHGRVDREYVADERQLVSRYWAKWMN
jgi:glutamate-ammonia-ligase adenylyltransferase